MDELLYKTILQRLPFGYAMHKIVLNDKGLPEDYEYLEANYAFEKFTGLNKDQIIGKKVTEILPTIKTGSFDWIKYYGDIAINGGESEFEQYSVELEKWYRVKVFSPKKGYFITFFIDISDETKENNLYKSILSSIEEGIIATDLDGNITMINETAEKLTGWKKEDILQEKIYTIFKAESNENKKDLLDKIFNVIKTGDIISDGKNIIIKQKNGNNIPIVYNLSPIKRNKDIIYGTVISFLDITEKIAKEKEIDYMTYHDSLTGLYNRNFFNNEIKTMNKEENLPLSIIMGDVNGLKLTNDAFGHLMGDKLLVTAASMMKKVCREKDIAVRWGGDEFIILLPKTKEDAAQSISERIKEECEKEDIGVINLSISLGYATKNNIEEDIMKTITNSEDMMYRKKMLESKSEKSKTLKRIIKTLNEKSKLDAEHSKNVSKICFRIGKAMELSAKEISELEILGDIHDIGKIGIDENILNKSSKLSEMDWIEIKKHPEIGYYIILSSNELSFLADSVLDHHEWYDGTGYPKGIKGEEIPLRARILSIADAFDTMISYRPYKKSLTINEAIDELIKYKGIQFDPKLVDLFIEKIVEKNRI